jgi:hypothetical protein
MKLFLSSTGRHRLAAAVCTTNVNSFVLNSIQIRSSILIALFPTAKGRYRNSLGTLLCWGTSICQERIFYSGCEVSCFALIVYRLPFGRFHSTEETLHKTKGKERFLNCKLKHFITFIRPLSINRNEWLENREFGRPV